MLWILFDTIRHLISNVFAFLELNQFLWAWLLPHNRSAIIYYQWIYKNQEKKAKLIFNSSHNYFTFLNVFWAGAIYYDVFYKYWIWKFIFSTSIYSLISQTIYQNVKASEKIYKRIWLSRPYISLFNKIAKI